MIPVFNCEEYIHRKGSGENVVSVASVYGSRALASNPTVDDFLVLELNRENYSFYRYTAKGGKLSVSSFKEMIPYAISSILPISLLQDDAVTKWWNIVFYEKNGADHYDRHYDSLSICEGESTIFGDLLENLSVLFSNLALPSSVPCLCVAGELARNPMVRHSLRKVMNVPRIVVLPSIAADVDVDENHLVELPVDVLKILRLNVDGSISFSDLVSSSVRVTIPMDMIDRQMVEDMKWMDILVDSSFDFKVGEMGFKNVDLRVECDIFQHVFLASKDFRGNRKVIQFN